MDIVRRVSALTLVVALSLIGIPLPAHAAGEESPRLTINGHALSQLLNRTAPGDPLPLAGLLGQETGQISGVALNENGQPLAAQAVQLKQVFTSQGRRAEQVSGRDTTNADDAFSFTGLQASDYLVEVLSGDEVIASAPVTLADGAMQVSGISVAPPAAASDPNWWPRRSTAAKVGIVVGIGFGVLIALMAADCADGQGSYIGPCG